MRAQSSISAAPFTPQKSHLTSAGKSVPPVWGTEAPQPLKELPVKPFFFASVDLIEHLLAWSEEEKSLAPAVCELLK